MKRRIEKLFNEAGFHKPEVERLGIEHKFEKFAELIVGECFYCVEIMEKIAHASNADIPLDYDKHTYLKTLETVKSLMKVHFGVEE